MQGEIIATRLWGVATTCQYHGDKCFACKTAIEFNRLKNTSKKIMPVQKHGQQLHKAHCSLTITILVMGYSTLFHTFHMWFFFAEYRIVVQNMHTTIGRWVEIYFSSFTWSIIYNKANSTSFIYSWKLESNIWDVVSRCCILIKKLMSNGGIRHVVTFDFIVSLNMLCW